MMIDDQLKKAIQDFTRMSKIDAAVFPHELRPDKLPKDKIEAVALFRALSYRHMMEACELAMKRVGIAMNLDKWAFFFRDRISFRKDVWNEIGNTLETVIRSSVQVAEANLPSVIRYARDGMIIGGEQMANASQFEISTREDISRETLKVFNMVDEYGEMNEYFNGRAIQGLPPYDSDECPQIDGKVPSPEVAEEVIRHNLTSLSANFSACVGIEEQSIRTLLARAHFIIDLERLVHHDESSGRSPIYNEVLDHQKSILGCLNRAELYYGRGQKAMEHYSTMEYR